MKKLAVLLEQDNSPFVTGAGWGKTRMQEQDEMGERIRVWG